MFLALSLAFLLITSLKTSEAFDICSPSSRIQSSGYTKDLMKLQNACSSDEVCSFYYSQQQERKNFTVFEALSIPSFHLREEDLDSVRRDLCSLQNEEELFQWLWKRELVYTRSLSRPQCGANQVLSMNKDSSMECMCTPGSDCSDCVCNDDLEITILVVILIILVLIFIKVCFNNQSLYRLVDSLK